ncbi:MAG: type 12 methyltransferase [Microgenomates group bacterium Gr01-1014_16]|nr:MAG: type 12 methyltransferase [Microgenomates group bacterium Gr01-1014_16]
MPSDPVGEQTLEIMNQAEYYNQWLYSLIRPWISGKVAEAGVGTGNFLNFFKRDNISITAIDINPSYLHQIARTHPKEDIFQFDLQSSILPARLRSKFDTVVTLNVLEHVPKISQAIKNIYAMLKPGGKAIILVPAFNFAYSSLDKNLGHVKRYSIGQINGLTRREGFQEIKSFYINPAGLIGWFIIGKILKKGSIPLMSVKFFDIAFRPILWLERRVHFPIGLSLIIIVQKP